MCGTWAKSGVRDREDVYATTNRDLWHFDGKDWSSTGIQANGVSGAAANNVVVSSGQTLLHFNGTGWDTLLAPQSSAQLGALWVGDGPSAVVGLHFSYNTPDSIICLNEGTWSVREPAPGWIAAMVGWSIGDLIAVGRDANGGMAWHGDGVGWTPTMPSGVRPTIQDVSGLPGRTMCMQPRVRRFCISTETPGSCPIPPLARV